MTIKNIGDYYIAKSNVCKKCNYPWNPSLKDYTECKICGTITLICPRCKDRSSKPEPKFTIYSKEIKTGEIKKIGEVSSETTATYVKNMHELAQERRDGEKTHVFYTEEVC